MLRRLGIEVKPGETEHVSFMGKRARKSTILVSVGSRSISKQALILGLALILCQLLDGVLTFIGLSLMGIEMEGNSYLRELMHAYGMAPTLFLAKSAAIILAVYLMLHAHARRWIRPAIFMLVLVYLTLAVVPWTYFISEEKRLRAQERSQVAESAAILGLAR